MRKEESKMEKDINTVVGDPFKELTIDEMTKIQGNGTQSAQSTPVVESLAESFALSYAISRAFKHSK